MNGQAYSLIAILILLPIFLFLSGYLGAVQDTGNARGDRIIARQLAQVGQNIEDDFLRAIEASGRRALLAQTNHISLTGSPIDDAILRTEELMVNGTLDGNLSVLMFNNTLGDWLQNILGVSVGFIQDVEFTDIVIQNGDGFHVEVNITLIINLSHAYSNTRLSKQVTTNISVSVEGLDDPLYLLESGGATTRQILRYPFQSYAIRFLTGTRAGNCTGEASFTSGEILITTDASMNEGSIGTVAETDGLPSPGSCYSVENPDGVTITNATLLDQGVTTLLLDEATGVWIVPISDGVQYYNMFSSSGPDFLKRLEGKIDQSVNGLESFVEDGPGLPVKPGQSRLDYHYFSSSVITGSRVRGMPSWFRIPAADAARYNLTSLVEG